MLPQYRQNNFLDYYQSTSIKVRVVDGSHVANGFNHGAWRTIHILPMVSTMGLNGAMGIGMAIGNKSLPPECLYSILELDNFQ